MVRVIAVEIAILFIVVILMIGEKFNHVWLLYSIVGIVLLTTIVYCVKIYRLKDVEGPEA